MDSHGTGLLNISAIPALMRALGDEPTPQDLQELKEMGDAGGDGRIAIDDFITWYNF